MIKQYCIEVSSEQITPITVQAENEQDAKERALKCQGDSGDSYPGELKIISLICLNDD